MATASSAPSLCSLDLRRNNLRYDQDAVAQLFRVYVPHLSPNLTSLNLSATGLTATSTMAVLEGVFCTSSPIRHLDISNNFDSLYELLKIVVQALDYSAGHHRQKLHVHHNEEDDDNYDDAPSVQSCQLQRLVLVSDNSIGPSTCLDYHDEEQVILLERLADLLSGGEMMIVTDHGPRRSTSVHCNLSGLGPLSILPFDQIAVTESTISDQYERCRKAVDGIHFALQVNEGRSSLQQIMLDGMASLLPLAWAAADTRDGCLLPTVAMSTVHGRMRSGSLSSSSSPSPSMTVAVAVYPSSNKKPRLGIVPTLSASHSSIQSQRTPSPPSLLYYWIRETSNLIASASS